MKFPKSEVDRDGYLRSLHAALSDEECLIFLDTNILARFYSFNSVARTELRNYLQGFVSKGRLKVPAWVMNEYSKHFMRKKTSQYYETANKISTIVKEFKTFSGFAKMFVEDTATSRDYGYADAVAFHADLDDIQKKLENFLRIKSIKGDYTIKVHNELEALLANTVLDTDIFELVEKIQLSGKGRYAHELPPGFEDGGKKKNSFGDLIAWQEILRYCKTEKKKKVIILTNDEKRDWLYAPQKLLHRGKSVSNANDEFRIADPRLVYEFKKTTGSEDIFIVNLSTLTSATLDAGDRSLMHVGTALQVQVQQAQESAASSDSGVAKDTSANDVTEILSIEGSAEAIVEEQKSTDAGMPTTGLSVVTYSSSALADAGYTRFVSTELANIVQDLKSYNWYVQNPAIEQLCKLLFDTVKDIEKLHDDLFVVGRNIYQAACGGAFEAVDFVENTVLRTDGFPPRVRDHIVSGIFYELYFDSNNQLRKGAFKIVLIDPVFRMAASELFKNSTAFIRRALDSYTDFLLVIPALALAPIQISVSYALRIATDPALPIKHLEITSLRYVNEELLVNAVNPIAYSPYLTKSELKGILSRVFAIPEYLIFLEFPEKSPEGYFYIPNNKAIWRGPLPDMFTKSDLTFLD